MTRKHEDLDPRVVQLAKRALQKQAAGGKLTREEARAVERVKAHQEEEARWRHYATIPKAHYIQLSGRQQKILDDQHRRYGMPVGGKTIDLGELLRWIHQLLADHGRKLLKPDDRDDLLYGGDGSPALERYREEQYMLARLERLEREGQLVSLKHVTDGLTKIAAHLRELGEELKKQHGNDALDLLNSHLDECDRMIEAHFASEEVDDEDAEA